VSIAGSGILFVGEVWWWSELPLLIRKNNRTVRVLSRRVDTEDLDEGRKVVQDMRA
jgi:hypothetical protein